MGYNYLFHGNTDLHHERFPWQFSVGTEEGSTNTTRGIYEDDPEKQYLAAYDRDTPSGFFAIRKGWQHYAARDYLAGMFIWTGFDYRGEPTPFRYPSVVSYFGMYDLCGFPKDNVYYLKSWWTNEEVLHILPHWNWQGREGEPIDVWVYSNMDEVELFLNNKSLGRKTMEKNSYLSWEVPFKPGSIKAVAFKDGKKRLVKVVETTGKGDSIKLEADKTIIKADRMDLAVVTVKIIDNKGRTVPDAANLVSFDISGPARIIGVGNGDPTSLEPDQFVPQYKRIKPGNWKAHKAEGIDVDEAVRAEFDAVSWEAAFQTKGLEPGSQPELTVYKGSFTLIQEDIKGQVTWLFNSIATGQSVYLNGQLIAKSLSDSYNRLSLRFDPAMLKVGDNHLVILGYPLVKQNIWDEMNTDPGEILIYHAAPQWQRKTFNGLAQVIIQSDGEPGDIVLKAKGEKLKASELRIEAR
jgi:beta-galactosidase